MRLKWRSRSVPNDLLAELEAGLPEGEESKAGAVHYWATRILAGQLSMKAVEGSDRKMHAFYAEGHPYRHSLTEVAVGDSAVSLWLHQQRPDHPKHGWSCREFKIIPGEGVMEGGRLSEHSQSYPLTASPRTARAEHLLAAEGLWRVAAGPSEGDPALPGNDEAAAIFDALASTHKIDGEVQKMVAAYRAG